MRGACGAAARLRRCSQMTTPLSPRSGGNRPQRNTTARQNHPAWLPSCNHRILAAIRSPASWGPAMLAAPLLSSTMTGTDSPVHDVHSSMRQAPRCFVGKAMDNGLASGVVASAASSA